MRDGLWACSRECIMKKCACPKEECKYWIDYKGEYNCTLVAIYENGRMTLREVAERIGVSFARIKQIETKALQKLKKNPITSSLLF
tara:strand:- start:113 stop:370 length:258 start_codon:yes stop_codon:yes gene_type:complete